MNVVCAARDRLQGQQIAMSKIAAAIARLIDMRPLRLLTLFVASYNSHCCCLKSNSLHAVLHINFTDNSNSATMRYMYAHTVHAPFSYPYRFGWSGVTCFGSQMICVADTHKASPMLQCTYTAMVHLFDFALVFKALPSIVKRSGVVSWHRVVLI